MFKNRIRLFTALMLAMALLSSLLPAALAESAELGNTNIAVIDGVAMVYDPSIGEFVENAELTEKPVLDCDLKPEDPPQVPDSWAYDPALKVIAGNMEDGGADSSFTVNGSVTMETTAAGPSIAVYADCLEKDAAVTVNGDITSTVTLEEAPPEYARAIPYGITARSAGGKVDVTVDGTVTATGIAKESTKETAQENGADPIEGEGRAFAVYADAVGPAGVTTVHVTGDAVAHSEGNEFQDWAESYTIAVEAATELNGTAVIKVDGKAVAESTEHNFSAKAVDVYANTGSTAEITIGEGAEGQVVAKAKSDGTTKVNILDGGVTAAIKDPAEGASLAAVNLWNGAEEEEEEDAPGRTGTLEINITGDVTASGASENIGIQVRTDEGGKTDVIVDGTVAASDAAVVLLTPETQIGENVTLTVWELKPNEDGAVVSRLNEEEKLEEDEQAEKAVQYIIRVKADQQDLITAQGTTEYKGFNVAREGDTVTMLLNIPEGYEITGAYGDVNQSVVLAKDENGRYYLTVPRGGAVELSVKLEKIGDDGADGVAWDSVYRILKLADQTGKAEISFYSNGRYVVRYEDGASENGSFRLSNGTLVLTNDKDTEHTKMTAGLNAEKDQYELAFHPSASPETTYDFVIAVKDFRTLTAVRYALRAF